MRAGARSRRSSGVRPRRSTARRRSLRPFRVLRRRCRWAGRAVATTSCRERGSPARSMARALPCARASGTGRGPRGCSAISPAPSCRGRRGARARIHAADARAEPCTPAFPQPASTARDEPSRPSPHREARSAPHAPSNAAPQRARGGRWREASSDLDAPRSRRSDFGEPAGAFAHARSARGDRPVGRVADPDEEAPRGGERERKALGADRRDPRAAARPARPRRSPRAGSRRARGRCASGRCGRLRAGRAAPCSISRTSLSLDSSKGRREAPRS